MNGLADAEIGAAPANVAGHRVVDIVVGGFRRFAQQDGGGHDLARLAITALRHILIDPGRLERAAQLSGEALDGGHLLSGCA